MGGRGMDGRGGVPVDDRPVATWGGHQRVAARGAAGRGGGGSAELSPPPGQAPGRGAPAGEWDRSGRAGLQHGRCRARAVGRVVIQQLHLLGEVFANALARKQGELEAQRLRQDLTHIGRVSALGELTASLAHELSQPLTAILSNAQAAQRLVAAEVVDLESVREILNDIVADDKRAAAVISGLRTLIKKGEPELVPLDLNAIVGEVAWLLRTDTILRNVSMSLELALDLPRVRGDRVQLQQVVLNLVANGLEAMREPHAGARTLAIRTARDGAAALRVT